MRSRCLLHIFSVLFCAALVACGDSSPALIGDGVQPPLVGADPKAFCSKSSWVAGIHELCDGHLVYQIGRASCRERVSSPV